MANPLDPPPGLDPASRAIWVDTLQHIMAAGTLDRLDIHSLAAYVQAVRNHQKATTLIQASDVLITRDGKPIPNPALTIQQQAARTIGAFARQFRLTAAAPSQPPIEPAAPRGESRKRTGEPMQPRWCDQHQRYECAHQRSRGRGQCHGPACKDASGAYIDRCRMHRGERKAVVLAQQLGLTYGEPVQITAERALMQELWRTAGHVKWLGEQVAKLEAEALTWGTKQTVERWWGEFPGSEQVAKAGPHVLLDLYDRERKHLVHVSVSIISAGLAAQLVDQAKELGTASARVVDAILHDLNLTDEQWALVPVVAPRRFRELMPA